MRKSDPEFVLNPHLINICDSLFACLHSLPQVVVFTLQLEVVVKVTASVLPSNNLIHLCVVVAEPRRKVLLIHGHS